MCAICLGLAGHPRLLGRADEAKDFVRRGKTHGHVWITVSNGPGKTPTTIHRTLNAEANSSLWEVTNNFLAPGGLGAAPTKSSASGVRDLCESWNIQLDNMCQFLPQDKVVEFAKLSGKPADLLRATERSIGDGTLLVQHERLAELAADQAVLARDMDNLEKLIEKDKTKLEELGRDVEALKKRAMYQSKLHFCEVKLLWITAMQERRKFDESTEMVDKYSKKLEKLKADLHRQVQGGAVQLKDDYTKLRREVNELQIAAARAATKLSGAGNDLENAQVALAAQSQKLAKLGDKSREWREQGAKLREQVAQLEAGHDLARDVAPVDPRQLKQMKDKVSAAPPWRRAPATGIPAPTDPSPRLHRAPRS